MRTTRYPTTKTGTMEIMLNTTTALKNKPRKRFTLQTPSILNGTTQQNGGRIDS